jgi:hypothetical protein
VLDYQNSLYVFHTEWRILKNLFGQGYYKDEGLDVFFIFYLLEL